MPSASVPGGSETPGLSSDSVSNENYHRPSLSSSSFKSLSSYPSFRSCTSYKSIGSFRSVVSKRTTATHGTSFYSCVGEGQVNRGFEDSESFYSLTLPDQLDSLKTINATVTPLKTNVSPLLIKPEPSKSYPTHIQSLLLLVLSTIFFSTASILLEFFSTQNVQNSLSLTWLVLLLRSIFQIIISSSLLVIYKLNPIGPTGQRWALFAIAVVSFFLTITTAAASMYLNSSVGFLSSMVITSLPLTLLLALLVAKESLGIYRTLTSVLFLIGVALLVRPSFLISNVPYSFIHSFNVLQFNPLGISILTPHIPHIPKPLVSSPTGLVSASLVPVLFSSLLILIHRSRAREVSVAVLLMWTGLGILLASVVGLGTLNSQIEGVSKLQKTVGNISDAKNTSVLLNTDHFDFYSVIEEYSTWAWGDWLAILSSICLSTSATLFSCLSAAKLGPSRAALIRSVQLLLTFALQAALFPSLYAPVWLDLCGAVVMTVAVIFVGVEEMIVDKHKWKWF